MKTFRGIVREAVEAVEPHRVMEGGITAYDADEIAQLIEIGLRSEGIRLHDVEKCEARRGIVMPSIENVGRPITAELLRAHGRDPAVYGFTDGE